MTIEIDGANQLLWQWDKGQRLILTGIADNTYIDLSNEGDSNAVRMTPYTENEVIYVDIPDVLLEKPRVLKVYAYLDDETVFFTVFNILRRPMPEDYVPTEQVLLWHTLDERIKKLELEIGSGSANEIKSLTFVVGNGEKIVYDGSKEVNITTPSLLPNPHTLSINGVSYDGSEDINVETNVTVWGYYLSLSQAMADVNSGIRDNSIADISSAKVKVFTSSAGILTVMLLDNISENEMIPINVQMRLTLNGKTLILTDVGAYLKFTVEDCTIDGRAAGSAIVKDFGDAAESCYFVDTTASLTILGGSYRVSGANTGTVTAIRASNTCEALTMEDCAVDVINTADGAGYTRALQTQAAQTMLRGVTLKVDTALNGQGVFGIGDIRIEKSAIYSNTNASVGEIAVFGISLLSGGILHISDTYILADSPECEAGENLSVGIGIGTVKNSTIFADNCYISGTHSGISAHGNLYIDGGTYTGYSHGGAYFASGPDGINYINDAVIRCGNYEGVHDYAEPRENHSPLAAFYIGGGDEEHSSNVTVYMDGCSIEGVDNTAFVIRGTSGETNNRLYISNSVITKGNYVRVDNDTHKLYVGTGMSITEDMISNANSTPAIGRTEYTSELYRRHHVGATMDGSDYDALRKIKNNSGNSSGFIISNTAPEDTSVLWVDTSDSETDLNSDANDITMGISGATVGQTVRITAVDEKGVPTAWEAVDMPSGGEVWELLVDITLEEEVETIMTGLFERPQKKIRIALDSLAAETNTNYTPVTVWTDNVEWNRHIKFYPPAMPMTKAITSVYEVEIFNDTEVKVSTSYADKPSDGKVANLTAATNSQLIWTPIDIYSKNIYPHITAVSINTYATWVVGTRLRVWGVAK